MYILLKEWHKHFQEGFIYIFEVFSCLMLRGSYCLIYVVKFVWVRYFDLSQNLDKFRKKL